MLMREIIRKKRDGEALTDAEIAFFIRGYLNGKIRDFEASALLMAICFQGMDERETLTLTLEMARSGEQLDLSSLSGVAADKHSTGGVGDKTTLIVAPLVAAMGGRVAKMSGRGSAIRAAPLINWKRSPAFKRRFPASDFCGRWKRSACVLPGRRVNSPRRTKRYIPCGMQLPRWRASL